VQTVVCRAGIGHAQPPLHHRGVNPSSLPTASTASPETLPPQATLSATGIALACGFAVVVALLFSTFFATPLPVLLGRTLFLAMALLLVFVLAQRWPERWRPRWLPRWALPALAVGMAAPLAAWGVYLVSVGGDIEAMFDNPGRRTGFVVTTVTALLIGLVVTLASQLREREARARALELKLALQRSQLEKQALAAQLTLLQAQVEPHFLFNTLANVQALVDSGSPRASEVLTSLVAYLRTAVPRLQGDSGVEIAPTLEDELGRVRAYLALMQLRMPDRLAFRIVSEPSIAGLRLPPLTLMTLVENAIRHGVDPSLDGGEIEVGARALDADRALLWVADTGVGMAESAEPGTGLTNLRERVAAFWGQAAALRWQPVLPHGLRVEIEVPR
jgi:signal transduction histidine kinase